jgi:uncharacterized protein (TIGR03437 family)
VTIGGAPAQVPFLGLAPGFVGLGQMNVLVPESIAAGDRVPLTLELAGQRSNTVSVSVR